MINSTCIVLCAIIVCVRACVCARVCAHMFVHEHAIACSLYVCACLYLYNNINILLWIHMYPTCCT